MELKKVQKNETAEVKLHSQHTYLENKKLNKIKIEYYKNLHNDIFSVINKIKTL